MIPALKLIYLLVLAVISASCSSAAATAQAAQGRTHPNQVTDHASLLNKLRVAGVSVEPAGTVEQPFLSVSGKMIKVHGEDVQIFEYSSSTAMETETARIAPDGSGAGTRKIFWAAPPHFYKQGKVLVLYVGDNGKVKKILEAILGRQFAGQS